jgi:hypothetical protein
MLRFSLTSHTTSYDLEEVDASIAVSFSPSFAEEWRSLQRRNPSEKEAFKKAFKICQRDTRMLRALILKVSSIPLIFFVSISISPESDHLQTL